MRPRIGIDLVAEVEVASSLSEHGERYAGRILTPQELERCRQAGVLRPRRIARHVAAKEAAMKVLEPAHDDALPWQAIELDDRPPAPRLALHGPAVALADAARIDSLTVSIAVADGVASAVVTGFPVLADRKVPS